MICNNKLMVLINRLKEKGYRVTKARRELLKVLAHYPLTVQEIYNDLIEKKIHIDLTSVYRSLELFVTMGIVREVDLGEDKKRYEMIDKNNHHHHLICNNCKLIEDVVVNEDYLLKTVGANLKFKIDHHNLEFFGLCQNCQQP